MRKPWLGRTDRGNDRVGVGPFTFDERTRELFSGDRPVRLQPKPSLILAELVAARGRLVDRERLYEVAWGDTVVEFDLALNRCIKDIRAAVGDDAGAPWFVATVPRRGYRLVPPVEAEPPAGRRWWVGLAVSAALVAATLPLLRSAPPAHTGPSVVHDATILSFQSFGTGLAGIDQAIQDEVYRRLGLGTGAPQSTGLFVNGVILPAPSGALLEVTLVRLADGEPVTFPLRVT